VQAKHQPWHTDLLQLQMGTAPEQAAGVDVNLWIGLVMLIVGALFIAWAFKPLSDELEEAESEQPGSRAGGH
jgi:hypothetical protein